MEKIYMVTVNVYSNEKLAYSEFEGAFKTFRGVSEWLVDEGFEPFYNNEFSDFFEENTISFIYIDKENKEEHYADILDYTIKD